MIIKKKYTIRHKILKGLQEDLLLHDPHGYMEEEAATSTQLAKLSGLTNGEIYSQIDFLISIEEIGRIEIDFSDKFYITTKGTIAYYNKKYIEQGRVESFSWFKEWAALISVIIAILVSITSILTYLETKKNSDSIEVLNKHLKGCTITTNKNNN